MSEFGHVCRYAWFLYLFYLAALAFYLYVRITKTLGLGRYFTWWGPCPNHTFSPLPCHAIHLCAPFDVAMHGEQLNEKDQLLCMPKSSSSPPRLCLVAERMPQPSRFVPACKLLCAMHAGTALCCW
jgi:hypothetical protein